MLQQYWHMNARWEIKITMGRASKPCSGDFGHADDMGRFGARLNLPFTMVWEDFQEVSGDSFPSHPLVLMSHNPVSPRSSGHLLDETKKSVSVLELGITYHTGKASCWIFDCSCSLKHGSCWTGIWWWDLKFIKENHYLYWKVLCCRLKTKCCFAD